MPREIIVLVTCRAGQAEKIARPLVEEHLAACVNIVPAVASLYRWQGNVVDDKEDLLIVKTTEPAREALEKRILELHTYEIPEIISFEISGGYKPYLNWLHSSVTAKP